ncbi:unnamed protein product [Thlaspi arvense]|uniref:FBD domain-containing protein n=1 Tax=Thlaspi arvense TaxID=13288 RepID=A0AAU9T3C5_THLAR|nr:unnamed protein product [Thlaspi arvense]
MTVKKFTVQSPYLSDLSYSNYSSDDSDAEEDTDSDVEDTDRCLVIDTPAFTYLDIDDYSADFFLIENKPNCCEQVCVNLHWSFPDIDKFFRSFSAVLFLELNLNEKMIVCFSTIKFSRLTKCKILPGDTDWMDSLVSFLQNTPKLKFLTVDYLFTHQPPDASISWSESSYDPECLSSSLEKFELKNYGGRKEEKELVEYILTTSRCLKTAIISLSLSKLEDKDTTIEELKAIPRVSLTSQLFLKNDELSV